MNNNENKLNIPVLADEVARGNKPEYLLWIGCAGSYDERYKKVIRSFILVLNRASIDFAVLGPEESCTGDPARRAGNEFLFQMQALSIIGLLNNYGVKKILTSCPHCYHIFKNEYPALGGIYEVFHHSQFIDKMLEDKVLEQKESFSAGDKKITYHDSCYLGRSNNIYEPPRNILKKLQADLVEMSRIRENGLCCGAGGAQLFKDPEKGNKEINVERTEEALKTEAGIIATACPFCMTMMTDGVKHFEKGGDIQVLDIVELIEKGTRGKLE
jgi:Fe-S oxidoreductase